MKIYKWQQKFWAVLASLWCCVSYKHSYWTIYTCLGWLRHCCMCIWCYSFAGLIQDGRYWCGASCWGWWLTLSLTLRGWHLHRWHSSVCYNRTILNCLYHKMHLTTWNPRWETWDSWNFCVIRLCLWPSSVFCSLHSRHSISLTGCSG